MGGSIRPEQDIGSVVAALRAQGADDEAVHRFLTERLGAQEVSADPNAQRHADFKSGALQRRTRVLNARDEGQAADDIRQDEDVTRGKVLGTLAAPLSAMPGGALVQRSVSGDETADAIASAPAVARVPAKILGAGLATAVLPGSAAMQGARFGALSGLLQDRRQDEADGPNLGGRIRDAALEGGIGLATGFVAGNLFAPKASAQRLQLLKNRAAATHDLYAAAEREGNTNAVTRQVADFLEADDIAPIVRDIQASRVPPKNTGELLKAVNEHLSDQSLALQGKNAALNPRFQNQGRRALGEVRAQKDALYEAANTPQTVATAPGDVGREAFMPSLQKADAEYAKQSGLLRSFDRGYDAMSATERNALPSSAKNLNRPEKGGEAFGQWARGQVSDAGRLPNGGPTPEELMAATEGGLARLRGTSSPLHPIRSTKNLVEAVKLLAATKQFSPLVESSLADPTALQRALRAVAMGEVLRP